MTTKWKRPRKINIGDMVEVIARPIAKTIDDVLGTNVSNCEGCQKRKEYLNNLTKDSEI